MSWSVLGEITAIAIRVRQLEQLLHGGLLTEMLSELGGS